MKSFIYIFGCIFLILSCSKNNDKVSIQTNEVKPNRADTNLYVKPNSRLFLDTNDPIQKKYYHAKLSDNFQKIDFSNNLSPDQMIELLNFKISNFEKAPISSGTIHENEGLITYAKAQFVDIKNKSNIILDLFDYGKNGKIPNKQMFTDKMEREKVEFLPLVSNNLKGVAFLDSTNKHAKINVLLNNRITIIISADNYNYTLNEFCKILNFIDFNRLKNLSLIKK